MRDPDLVHQAERAAAALEQAWIRWRTRHGLATGALPPVSSYVGYSVEEPWGQPRVVFGIEAAEAARLAAILDEDACAGPAPAELTGVPARRQPGTAPPAWTVPSSTAGVPAQALGPGKLAVRASRPGDPAGKPGAPSDQPGHAAKQSDGSGQQPGGSLLRPGVAADQPDAAADQSNGSGRHPGGSVLRPDVAADQPAIPTDQSNASGRHPGGSVLRPDVAADQPAIPADQPNGSGRHPGGSLLPPDVAADQPAIPADQPNGSGQHPGGSLLRPDVAADQPDVLVNQPGVPVDQPVVPAQHSGRPAQSRAVPPQPGAQLPAAGQPSVGVSPQAAFPSWSPALPDRSASHSEEGIPAGEQPAAPESGQFAAAAATAESDVDYGRAEELTAEQPILPRALRRAAALADVPAELPDHEAAYLQELAARPGIVALRPRTAETAPVANPQPVTSPWPSATYPGRPAPLLGQSAIGPGAEQRAVSPAPVGLVAPAAGFFPPAVAGSARDAGTQPGTQPPPADGMSVTRLLPVSRLNRTRKPSEPGSWPGVGGPAQTPTDTAV